MVSKVLYFLLVRRRICIEHYICNTNSYLFLQFMNSIRFFIDRM